MKLVLQLAYRLQRQLWKLIRPQTRGVKIILFNTEGQILLIRNSYGARHLFVLPGGGVKPWEQPDRAAHREVQEELGCSLRTLVPLSTHHTSAEGKRDTVYLFEAELVGNPTPNGAEVAEARFFGLAALPQAVSPATMRRLAERRGVLEVDGSW
jgi:ADP-ribose pyrophosphatase YjhB (NUDIX family)